MIKFHKEAVKFINTQEYSTAIRLYQALDNLPEGDIKRMKAVKGQAIYRLRVGKYRILFTQENGIFYIRKIDSRGDIYKGF